MNFNWSDLVKKNKSSSKIVQENKTEGKQLFLKMTGPVSDLEYTFDKEEIKNERKEKINKEKEIIKSIIKGELVPEQKKEPEIFEVEWEEETDSIKEVEKPKKTKKKLKKKDSSKINKFLKKLGVEDEVKEKPKFEIDQ
jgi:PP-loop superfamily ATP-utilizing enzyme